MSQRILGVVASRLYKLLTERHCCIVQINDLTSINSQHFNFSFLLDLLVIEQRELNNSFSAVL